MFTAPLFDRLADTLDQTLGVGALASRAAERRALVDSVARELQLLLNTHCAAPVDLDRYPEVSRSVLYYGMPSLAGAAASALNRTTIADRIRAAISYFEPRLGDVRVMPVLVESGSVNLRFHIQGVLRARDDDGPVVLETQIGLGDGNVQVTAGGAD